MDDQYENMTLNELKQHCRNNGLKGFSKYTNKESIKGFIRRIDYDNKKNNSENQDKDDIIKKLQEDLKKKHDRVKELELKEAFEDSEVNNSHLSDNEDYDVDLCEFHEQEEQMREEIRKEIEKEYEQKLTIQKDVMHHNQIKKQLKLDSIKWDNILCLRKEKINYVMEVIKNMGKDVKLIDTNVNKYLIQRYEHFLNYNGDKDKQIILFHGTDEKNIKPIMENGFSLTMNKKHGAIHGEGIYFTDDIDFAMIYPKDGSLIKNILVCQVYVNNKIEGKKALNTFPKIDGSDKYYDTGVDSLYKSRQFIKKSVDDINILGHIQINKNNVKVNTSSNNKYSNLTGIKILNKTSKTLSIFWDRYNHNIRNIIALGVNPPIKFFKSMGDVSPDDIYHIKSRIGDQFILGYYDKDKHFNINRVINVTIKNQVFTID